MKPYTEEEFKKLKDHFTLYGERNIIRSLIATVDLYKSQVEALNKCAEQDQDTIRELEREIYLLNGGCD